MRVPCATAPVPAALEPTFHVTAVLGLLVPVTEAVNWSVPPLCTDWFEGLTVTLLTVGAGILTVTAALPDFDESALEVAMTKRVVAVSSAATVSSPLASIRVPRATEPVPAALEPTLQVTAVLGLLVPVTEAVNWRVPPFCTDWFCGLTVTLLTVGWGALMETETLPDFDVSAVEVAMT